MLSKYGAHGWGSDSNLHPNSNHLGENNLKTRKNYGLVLPTTIRFLYWKYLNYTGIIGNIVEHGGREHVGITALLLVSRKSNYVAFESNS